MNTDYDLFPAPGEPFAEFSYRQKATIREAIGILETRIRETEVFTNPMAVKQFCRLQLAADKDECFACLFLDTRHRLIQFERLFNGTVDGASVYPRIIVRRALELNASAVIFSHNHPSGVTEPSQDDISITEKLKQALALVDVRVLDHIIVGAAGTHSCAESGLI